jgi:SAM-dependent methyltransferase
MPELIDRSEGRRLFGLNPEGYADARPDYPPELYRWLVDSGALRSGGVTLEIGAGSGLATRRLIELGASPITVIEPDERFAPLLRKLRDVTGADLRLIEKAFEDTSLPSHTFDLVAAATAFHWLDPIPALQRIAEALVPGGFVALWWNVFQDLDRVDPFHDATRALLADLAISSYGPSDAVAFPLDRRARESDFACIQEFTPVTYAEIRWTLELDTEQVARLYEGFSHIQRLPRAERARLLDALRDVARTEFAGRVERNMTTPLYLARRR